MKAILFISFFSLLFFSSIKNNTANAETSRQKAPGIALEDTSGKLVLLSSLLSQSNVVISFWSYDCLPCRKEMPELQRMADSGLFRDKNVKIVFVYVETISEKTGSGAPEKPPVKKAVEVLQNLEIKEMCLMDIYGIAYNKYLQSCKIGGKIMPVLFLVNKNKDIIFSAIGYDVKNMKELKETIENKL